MDADSHVESIVLYHLAHFGDNLYHANTKLDHVVSLFSRTLPVSLVHESHHHVAVADGVQFEEVQSIALHVELSEEFRKHFDDLTRSHFAGVVCVPTNISKENCHVCVGLASTAQSVVLLNLVQKKLHELAAVG